MRIRITLEVEHLGSPTPRMRIAINTCIHSSYPHTVLLRHNPFSIASYYIYILVLSSSYAHVINLRYMLSIISCWGQTIYNIHYSRLYISELRYISTIYLCRALQQLVLCVYLHTHPSYRIMHHAIPRGSIHIVFINTYLICFKPTRYTTKIRHGLCLCTHISYYTPPRFMSDTCSKSMLYYDSNTLKKAHRDLISKGQLGPWGKAQYDSDLKNTQILTKFRIISKKRKRITSEIEPVEQSIPECDVQEKSMDESPVLSVPPKTQTNTLKKKKNGTSSNEIIGLLRHEAN